MQTITLTITKQDVYDEVQRTTSYIGASISPDNKEIFDNIAVTESDKSLIDRFWNECKSSVSESFKRALTDESESDDGEYSLKLTLSSLFNEELLPTMINSLSSFFVMSIISKWLVFIKKSEAAEYATEAVAYLEDIKRKAFYKTKPTRPTY